MIAFSPNFFANLMAKAVDYTIISVYKGTPPVLTNDGLYVDLTSRSSDLLVTFPAATMAYTTDGTLYSSKTPAATNAVGTGTATWFMVHAGISASSTGFVGGVGTPDAGLPLQVASTELVTGQPVSIIQLAFKLTS